jgi:hypothetical protein
MTRIILAAILTVVTPALVLSQTTQRKQVALRQTERELIALSRQAVVNGVSSDIVVENRFTGTASTQGKFDTVEFVDAKPSINGDRALVSGRVVFKGGLPGWRAKETSTGVKIGFIKREGRWQLLDLCLGDCVE